MLRARGPHRSSALANLLLLRAVLIILKGAARAFKRNELGLRRTLTGQEPIEAPAKRPR